MENVLVFNAYSNTIRQMPQNYLIAHFDEQKRYWICDPDTACDKNLAARVFLELFNYESKYNKDGLSLLSKVTPNSQFKNVYFNIKTNLGTETVDELSEKDFTNFKDFRKEVARLKTEYRLAGMSVYTSNRSTKEWRNKSK